MEKFKNAKNTAGRTCECKDWISHFEAFSKTTVTYCAELSCSKHIDKDVLHGAHVVKVNSADKNEYILPLCSAHNNVTNVEEMEIFPIYSYNVSANVTQTCGRK